MEITQVSVFPIEPVEPSKLKAYVSVIFDACFVVSDIKVIEGAHGLFVSMPSKRRRNGKFRDIAHPLNHETRKRMEEQIIGEYRTVIARTGGEVDAPHRALDGEFGGAVAPEEREEASLGDSPGEDRIFP